MKNERRYNRLGERYGARVLFTFLGLVIISIAIVFLFWAINAHDRRLTLVVAGDPTTVATFDFTNHKLILLSFPASAQIQGIHGVGQYSLSSLWQLGFLDPKDSTILAGSLTQLCGIPIKWYLGFKDNGEVQYADSLSQLKKIFSLGRSTIFLSGHYISNLSLPDFLSLSWQMIGIRPDDIISLEVNKETVLYDHKLPDGTTVQAVDPNKLNALIGGSFEDEMIRSESLRVAVFNTTPTPELGSKIETLLTHAGILVVLVGNDSPEIDKCQVVGLKQFLATSTSKFINETYGCSLTAADNGGRADLELKIGRDFEQLFSPKN